MISFHSNAFDASHVTTVEQKPVQTPLGREEEGLRGIRQVVSLGTLDDGFNSKMGLFLDRTSTFGGPKKSLHFERFFGGSQLLTHIHTYLVEYSCVDWD